jgi:hypothetical protein
MSDDIEKRAMPIGPGSHERSQQAVSALRVSIPIATVPCVACGKALKCAIPGDRRENQPYAGTAFVTRGHYGSTVFDPMDDSALEINVCDDCLLRAGLADRVLHHKNRGPHRKRVLSWKRDAQAIETRRAETEGLGAQHESAVVEDHAPGV